MKDADPVSEEEVLYERVVCIFDGGGVNMALI